MASTTATRYCDKCHTDVSKSNWARHQQTYHPEDVVEKEIKGEQVWCKDHGWIAKSQQRRHYKRRHHRWSSGLEEPPRDALRRESKATYPVAGVLYTQEDGEEREEDGENKEEEKKGEGVPAPDHTREAACPAAKGSPAWRRPAESNVNNTSGT
jgi:hypothetical protein